MNASSLLLLLFTVGSVAITIEQGQHKEKESGLGQEKRVLKVEIKEMELAHQETVKTLKKVSVLDSTD